MEEDVLATFALLIALISFLSGVFAGKMMCGNWTRIAQVYLLQLVVNSALVGTMYKFFMRSVLIHSFFPFVFFLAITAAFSLGFHFSRR